VYPGGTYCDALPGGPRIVSYLTSPNSERQLYTRIHPSGVRYAFVGLESDHAWEWDGTQFVDHGVAHGVNAVCYDDLGHLHVNDGSAGSQGYRFWSYDEQRLLTGDETYNGSTTNGLAEWTRHGDVTVGQSYVAGDAATVLHDGVRRILEPGHCRFIQFHRVGSQCVVACWKMQENAAVLIWFDVSEIASLPLEQPAAPPPPLPPPPPPPMNAPDWSAFQNFLRVRWEQDRINEHSKPADQPGHPDGDYSHPVYRWNVVLQAEAFQQYVREWAKDHPQYGLLKQSPGRSEVNGFAIDYACSKHDGIVWSEDVVNSMGTNRSGINNNRPTQEARPEAFVSLVDDTVPPPPPPPPPPPTSDVESLKRELVELRSHIAALIAMNAELQTQINDSDDVMLRLAQQVAALGKRVDGLRFKVDIGKTWGHAHGATVIVEPQA
jgi:hypothetical protein